MALFLQQKTDGAHWAVWKTDEPLHTLLALLPERWRDACRQASNRFASESRKVEWLSVRVLLYTLLGEEKEILYSPEGKPYLSDHSFYISISHTRGYVAVALCPLAPVGIDIEQYGRRVHRVAERFVRPDEPLSAYQGDDTWSLLMHWSAKEALFKRMENADADLRKLRLLPFTPCGEGTLRMKEYVTEQQQVYTLGYLLHPDFVLTWTVD